MAYLGFAGEGYVGNFLSTDTLQFLYPAQNYAGRSATVESSGIVIQYYSNGNTWLSTTSGIIPGATISNSSVLPASALGTVTPIDAPLATTQTLPPASAAWLARPYGIVVLFQRGVGTPSFAVAGGDILRTTAGVPPCVQYGMCAAQVISLTEWALA